MKIKISMLVCLAAASLCATAWAADPQQLADAVIKASGGENWPKVKGLDFTFNVEGDGKLLFEAKHKWDLVKNTDEVTWNGKTVTVDMNDAEKPSGDKMEAFKRWTNDSYWLLAPLKLRDKGTHLADGGEMTIKGKTYKVLHLSFGKVGLTSGDQYDLYIDPETNLVRFWKYMPASHKPVHGTWDDYKDFNGLKLCTSHLFGNKHIFFTGVKVISD